MLENTFGSASAHSRDYVGMHFMGEHRSIQSFHGIFHQPAGRGLWRNLIFWSSSTFYSPRPLPPPLLCGHLLSHMLVFLLLVFSQPHQRRAGSCFDFVLPFSLYRKGEKGKAAPWQLAGAACFPSTRSFTQHSFSMFFCKAFKLPLR